MIQNDSVSFFLLFFLCFLGGFVGFFFFFLLLLMFFFCCCCCCCFFCEGDIIVNRNQILKNEPRQNSGITAVKQMNTQESRYDDKINQAHFSFAFVFCNFHFLYDIKQTAYTVLKQCLFLCDHNTKYEQKFSHEKKDIKLAIS